MSVPLEPSVPVPSSRPFRRWTIRFAAVALVFASLQFFAAMFIEQALTPGYSDSVNTISDLGVAPDAFIFNTSVIVLGALAFTAILALLPVMPRRRLTYVAIFFVELGTLGALSVGLFPEPSTAFWGQAHDAASIVTFLNANVGMTIFGPAMRRDPDWGKYWGLTFWGGLFSVVALAEYVLSFEGFSSYLGLGEGGLERVVAFPVLLWAILVGIVVLRKGRPLEGGSVAPRPAPS